MSQQEVSDCYVISKLSQSQSSIFGKQLNIISNEI